MWGHRVRRVVAVLSTVAVLVVVPGSPVRADDERWHPPVEGPVVDPFRPPSHAYGAGNRGLEYGVDVGADVRAVATGVVRWSGVVAGRAYVSVDHGSGLWSTYGPLDERSVVRGQQVRRGTRLGAAGPAFHLTARVDRVYVDPQLLLDGAQLEVALVSGVAAPSGAVGFDRAAIESTSPFVAAIRRLHPAERVRDLLATIEDWHHVECTPDGAPVVGRDGSGRVLIQVGGVTTTSDASTLDHLDTERLGYDDADVVGFSYAGGATPDAFGSAGRSEGGLVDELETRPYDAADTTGDIHQAAERLADLVEAVVEARPGQSIDIAAHSLGGAVTRLALDILAARHGGSPPVDLVVTMGSPHRAPVLATGAEALGGGDLTDAGERVGVTTAASDLVDTEVVEQLAGLDVPHEARHAGPPPPGVEVLAIAAATDTVVFAPEARWPGATNVVVDGTGGRGHTEVVASEASHRAIELHLAGAPPACRSIAEIALAAGAGQLGVAATSWLTAHLAALGALAD